MNELKLETIAVHTEEIRRLHESVTNFFTKSGNSPVQGSVADAELRVHTTPALVRTAYELAIQLFTSSDDHMMAFVKAMTVPVNTMASWTIVRGALEAAAVSAWLIDPALDIEERVKRSFACQYEGLDEQRKLCRAMRKSDEASLLSDRIESLAAEASSLGYRRLVDGSGKRTGIGMRKPSNTAIIENMLDGEVQYRVLSAMAHSLPAATSRLAHRSMSVERESAIRRTAYHDGLVFLEPHMAEASFGVLCHWLMSAVTKPFWFYTCLFGFDRAEMGEILDETTKNHIRTEARFWRKS